MGVWMHDLYWYNCILTLALQSAEVSFCLSSQCVHVLVNVVCSSYEIASPEATERIASRTSTRESSTWKARSSA